MEVHTYIFIWVHKAYRIHSCCWTSRS